MVDNWVSKVSQVMSMPVKPKRPCSYPSCNQITDDKYCDKHLEHARQEEAKRHRHYDKYKRDKQARDFYHSLAWEKAREQVLIRDHYLCQHCLKEKRITPADMVHHIMPVRTHWHLRLVLSNLVSLCNACHRKVHSRMVEQDRNHIIPEWLEPSAIPLTIVCGPSGSGKTTYVRDQADPEDIVIDLDEIKSRLSGMPWYRAGKEWTRPAIDERNRMLEQLSQEIGKQAWFIVSAPKSEERRKWKKILKPKKIVVLEIPYNVCEERLKRDERRSDQWERFAALAKEWWRLYTPNEGEERIR